MKMVQTKTNNRCVLCLLLFNILLLFLLSEIFRRQRSTISRKKKPDYFSDPVQIQRKRLIENVCQSEMSTENGLNKAAGRFLFYSNLNLSYCVVAKVGCTFWVGIIRYLVGDFSEDILEKHPMDLTKYVVHSLRKRTKHLTKDTGYSYLQNSMKFFFVRNPYTRLLSGYIDKFILPDLWTNLAGNIASLTRNKTNSNCVSDITFEEFLNYVVISETKNVHRNGHWIPIYKLCNPCQWNFSYIGKQETFMTDARIILQHFGLNHLMKKKSHLENMIFQTYSQSSYTFLTVSKTGICNNSWGFIAKRLWYVYQVQGYIRQTSQFVMPILKPGQEITFEIFQDITKNEMNKNTMTSFESLNQRKYFLLEAYSKIPLSLIKKIQKIYALDFKLFGYSLDSYR